MAKEKFKCGNCEGDLVRLKFNRRYGAPTIFFLECFSCEWTSEKVENDDLLKKAYSFKK